MQTSLTSRVCTGSCDVECMWMEPEKELLLILKITSSQDILAVCISDFCFDKKLSSCQIWVLFENIGDCSCATVCPE